MGAFTDNLVAKLARVVVPPHTAVRGGKRVKIEGYHYERQRSKINFLQGGSLGRVAQDVEAERKRRAIQEELQKLQPKSRIQQRLDRDKPSALTSVYPKEPIPDGVAFGRWLGQERLRPEAQKEILNQVAKLYKKWGVKVQLNATEGNEAEANGSWADTVTNSFGIGSSVTSILNINVPMFNSDAEVLKLNTFASRTHLAPQNRADIITHEYGHVLAHKMSYASPSVYADLEWPFIKAEEGGLSNSYVIDPNTGAVGEMNVASKLGLANFVSGYAAENVDDGIAEAFLQSEKGDRNYWTDHVRQYFEAAYQDAESPLYSKEEFYPKASSFQDVLSARPKSRK